MKSKFFNFRPTPYLLKIALKSVFPGELSFFYNIKKSTGLMPLRRRSDVETTSKRRQNDIKTIDLSKFGRTFEKNFVDFDKVFDFFRPQLRRGIGVDSTNHFCLGRANRSVEWDETG